MSISLEDILAWNPPCEARDKISPQLLKLTLIVLWSNPDDFLQYTDICRTCGCGERTIYRIVKWLRDEGVIEQAAVSKFGSRWRINPTKVLFGEKER